MGRALSADKASALRPTGDQGLCKHPDVPRQPSDAALSGRKRVGPSVLRTDSEPCEVLVWHSERDSGDKLRADRSTQISSACPLDIPTLLLPHTTQTNHNDYIRTKTFQANTASSTAASYLDYQAQHHQPHPHPQIV